MKFINRDAPEWDEAWGKLQDAINNNWLPTEGGGTTKSTLDDWMLMHLDNDGTAAFKHRDTRNYIYMRHDGELIVPKTKSPWLRGTF